MNGSGENVAGCASCAGRCCREYRVAVTVADVRTLAAGTDLHPREFLTLRPVDSTRNGFRTRPRGPAHELNLVRRPANGGCVFLMEIAPGKARCGAYAHRPLVCRSYPTFLRAGAVAVRPDVKCGPGSWSLAAMDLPGYRRDLVHSQAAWTEHWKIVTAWNAALDAAAPDAAPADLYEFLLTGAMPR